MRGAVLYGPRDVRIDNRPDPRIVDPTDARLRLSATCICGSRSPGPIGVSTPPAGQLPWAMSTAECTVERRRPRRGVHQAGTVRHRLVRRLRQHVSALSGGLPDVVRA